MLVNSNSYVKATADVIIL